MGAIWLFYQCLKCVGFIGLSDSLYKCVCECVCVCLRLAMASARLAAGISQSRDRTCCLSGRRVAIVTLSASLRCFWETIPHPNQPVWVSAAGRGSFFPSPTASLLLSLFFRRVLFFILFLKQMRGRAIRVDLFTTVQQGESWIQTYFHLLHKFTHMRTHTLCFL